MRLSRYCCVLLLIILLFIGGSDMSPVTLASGGSNDASAGDPSVACPATTNTTVQNAEPGDITLNVAGWSSSAAEDAFVQQTLHNFEVAHPHIHVKWTSITGDYDTSINAMIANHDAPDVFYLQPNMTYSDITDGALLNLSPYMQRDHVSAGEYYPAFMQRFSCSGGQVYGIPKDWDTLGVFYNKSLFQKAGIAFPDANWTWNDMRTIAKKLTQSLKKQGTYGITLTPNSSRWLAFLFANGGSVLNADGTHATFNDTAGVDALNFYTSFQNTDHSSALPADLVPSTSSWGGEDFEVFEQQRVAMVVEGGWLMQYLNVFNAANARNAVHYGVAPLPLSPDGSRANLIFTNAWGAYSHTRYPEAAWELIKYMTGAIVQTSALHNGFALPTLQTLSNDPYLKRPTISPLFAALSSGELDCYGPDDTYIHDRLNDAITSVLAGKSNARDALNNAAQLIDMALQSGSG